jgi:hypothetical protein
MGASSAVLVHKLLADTPTMGGAHADEDTSIMTPADEARFIELWTQGLESAAIGRQLGIPRGTVASRASTLVRQGKIQPRPRGGAYPKQKALARQEGAPPPVQRPAQTIDTGAVQALDPGPVQRLDRLDHPPMQTPVQITALGCHSGRSRRVGR